MKLEPNRYDPRPMGRYAQQIEDSGVVRLPPCPFPNWTERDWLSLPPGMRREIARTHNKN